MPKRAKPFYLSPAWGKLIADIKRARGSACEDAEHDPSVPRTGRRIYGDHVVELRDGGEPLDPRNILLRCPSCHTRKTNRERAARYAARPVP